MSVDNCVCKEDLSQSHIYSFLIHRQPFFFYYLTETKLDFSKNGLILDNIKFLFSIL